MLNLNFMNNNPTQLVQHEKTICFVALTTIFTAVKLSKTERIVPKSSDTERLFDLSGSPAGAKRTIMTLRKKKHHQTTKALLSQLESEFPFPHCCS